MWARRNVRVGRLSVCSCHPRVGATTPSGATHIAVGPVHVEVTHLRVVAFWKHATFRIGDDDLKTVLEVTLVVVVPHVDEVHIDRIVGPLPLDLPHRADVGVLPIACNLVVLGCREPGRSPVNDVAAKRDLALGVHVEVAVIGAVQLELPRVGVGADRNGVRRTVDVPPRTTLVRPRHLVGFQSSDACGRRRHGCVGFIRLHPTSASVVFQHLLQAHLLAGGALPFKAVVVIMQELQVTLVVEAFPRADHIPLWACHAKHCLLKRTVAVQNTFGIGRDVIFRCVLGRGCTCRGEEKGTQAKQAREG